MRLINKKAGLELDQLGKIILAVILLIVLIVIVTVVIGGEFGNQTDSLKKGFGLFN